MSSLPTHHSFAPEQQRSTTVTVRLRDDQLAALDGLATRQSLSRASTIRAAIGSALLLEAGKLVATDHALGQ